MPFIGAEKSSFPEMFLFLKMQPAEPQPPTLFYIKYSLFWFTFGFIIMTHLEGKWSDNITCSVHILSLKDFIQTNTDFSLMFISHFFLVFLFCLVLMYFVLYIKRCCLYWSLLDSFAGLVITNCIIEFSLRVMSKPSLAIFGIKAKISK